MEANLIVKLKYNKIVRFDVEDKSEYEIKIREVNDVKDDRILKNLTELNTPIGTITVKCSKENIPFDAVPDSYFTDYEIFDEDNETILAHIFADANYQIRIATSNLKIAEKYIIKFNGGIFDYNAGDEHTISLTGTFGGYSIGLSAYDPNDDEKMEQAYAYSKEKRYLEQNMIVEPTKYDISKFAQYTLDVLEDMSGYSFTLIDRSCEYIFFSVAWIRLDTFDADTYEAAVDFWIS
ncbi:hypothetical protein [Rummeliibacillus sp. SL167]|uniref:hypothetical protein n=1 Tax=Rummeliibacillus sp. SL167 TaxID=2579792 RepID=UPI0011B63AC4|nr:hypothetical protein [Rummeliibacillus sp. SL167]